ncbi:uncharacterized protein PF3D7_1120600 [Hydra vulgaris]|uniref:uncharacterized protein PF3D7_1120600 n=1 Tax=Hydra vulgaris TaxID=6087 RepID=UPI001F5E4AC8|nr:uncharacterized protein PF3D7_1120600-like isoform X1 [Hydra vulgaris]
MFSLLCFGFSFWSLIPYITIHSCSASGLNRNTESNLQTEGLRFPTTNYKIDHYQKQRDFINSKPFKRGKEFKSQPRFDKSSNVLSDMYSDSESIPYTNPDEEDAYTKGLINALTKNDDLLLKGSKYDIESLITGGLNSNKNSVHHNRETNDNKNKVLEKENALINTEHDKHNIHSKEHGISNNHFNGDNTMTYNHDKGDNNMNSHDEVESTINKYLYSDDVKNDLLSDNVPLDSSIKNEVLKYIDQDKPEIDETNHKMEENDHFKHYEHELKIGEDDRGEKNKNFNKFENEFNKDSKFENEYFFDNKHKNNGDSFEDGSKHSSLNGYSENMRYQSDFNKNFPEYHTKETNYLSHDQHQDINENENNSYEKFGETHNKAESNNELFESSQKDTNADKKFTTNLSNKVLDNNFFKHSVEGELLDEYKHYPNEYLTKEESLLESEKNVNQIRDAVKLDNEGLNNELSAINEEEEKIGSMFDKKNKSQQSLNGYEYGSQTESPIHFNYETNQIQENYKNNDEAKRFDNEDKKNDDYEEFDNETKELLNIDVRANGKIVDTNGQHATSKEEVFDQDLAVPFIQTPLNISFSSKNMSNFKNGSTLKMRSSKLEESMLLNEINNLQNELRTSKPRIITNSDAHFIVKKNFFTKRSETLNSKANQNNQDKTNEDLKVQNNQDIKAIIKKFRINKNSVVLLDKSSYEPQDKTRSKRNTKIRELKTNKSSLSLKKNATKIKNVTSINMDITKSKCQADKKHKEHVSCNPGTNYRVLASISGAETLSSADKKLNSTDKNLTSINSMKSLQLKMKIYPKESRRYTRRDSVEKSQDSQEGKNLQVVIKSTGCFDPPFHGSNCDATIGSIMINGVEISPNRPGFNIAIIDLKTGELEQAMSFNTHGEAGAFKKLENMLSNLEMWKIICIAVKDDAESYLPDSALHIFEHIGAHGIAKQKIDYRASYAFVGLSGPESARNKLNWLQEELTRAGDGPSIIITHIRTGLDAFKEAGGRIFESKIKVPASFYKSSFNSKNAVKDESKVSLDNDNDFERRVKVSNSNKPGHIDNNQSDESLHVKNNEENMQRETQLISDNQMPESLKNISDITQTKSEKLSDIEQQIQNLQLALSKEKQNYKNIVEMVMTQSSPDNLKFLNSLKNNLYSKLIENLNPSSTTDHNRKSQSNFLDKNLAAEDFVESQNHNQENLDIVNALNNLKFRNQFVEVEPERKKFSQNDNNYSEKQLDSAALKLIQSFENSASKENFSNASPVENYFKTLPVESFMKTSPVENLNPVSSLLKLSNAFNVLDGSENINEADSLRLNEFLRSSGKSSLNKIENSLFSSLKKNLPLNPLSQAIDKDETTSKTLPYSLINNVLLSLTNQSVPSVNKDYQEIDSNAVGSINNEIGINFAKATNYQNVDKNTNGNELTQSVLYKYIQDLLQAGNPQTSVKSYQLQSDELEDLQSFKKNIDGNKQFEVINSLGSNINSGVPNPAYDSSLEKEDKAISKSSSSHETVDLDSQYTGQGPFGSISQANVKKKPDYTENSSLVDSSLIKQVVEKIPNETVQTLVNLIKEKLTNELRLTIHSPSSMESKFSSRKHKAKIDDECESPVSKICDDECYKKNTLIGRYINIQSSDTNAVIKVNGQDWSKDEAGFNLVVLDFFTGEVDSTESFDTEVDGGASRAMTNFINSLAPGKLLLVATRGNAGELMGNNAYTALGYTGGRSLLTNHLNNGDRYVLLGATGNLRSLIQEDLVQYGSDIAEIKSPIVIGPGAMNDTCLCLKYCGANEVHRNFKEEHRSKGSQKEYDYFIGKKPATSDLVAKSVHVETKKPSEINDKVDNKESYDESYSQQLINNLLSSEFSGKVIPYENNEKNFTYSYYMEPENEASGYFGTDNAEKKSGNLINAKKKLKIKSDAFVVSPKSKKLKSDNVSEDIEVVNSDGIVLPVSIVEKETDLSSGDDDLGKAEIIFLKQNEQVASNPHPNHMKESFVNLEHRGKFAIRKKPNYPSITPGKKLVDNLFKALHTVKMKTNKNKSHKNSRYLHPVVKEQGLSLLTKYNIDFLSGKKKVDALLKKKEIEKQVKKIQHYDDVYSTIGNNLHS